MPVTMAQAVELLRGNKLTPEQRRQLADALKSRGELPAEFADLASAPAATQGPAASGDSTWAKMFSDLHDGRAPTAHDAWDRDYSLKHAGSGPNGTWTDRDWRNTYRERQAAYAESGGRDGGTPVTTGPSGAAPVATQADAEKAWMDALVGNRGSLDRSMSMLPDTDRLAAVGSRASMGTSMPGASRSWMDDPVGSRFGPMYAGMEEVPGYESQDGVTALRDPRTGSLTFVRDYSKQDVNHAGENLGQTSAEDRQWADSHPQGYGSTEASGSWLGTPEEHGVSQPPAEQSGGFNNDAFAQAMAANFETYQGDQGSGGASN